MFYHVLFLQKKKKGVEKKSIFLSIFLSCLSPRNKPRRILPLISLLNLPCHVFLCAESREKLPETFFFFRESIS